MKRLLEYGCSSGCWRVELTRVRRHAEQKLRSSRRSCLRGAALSIKAADSANEFTALRLYQSKLEMQLFKSASSSFQAGIRALPAIVLRCKGVLAHFHPL